MISCLCIQSIYLRLFWSCVDYTVGMIELLLPYLWPQMPSNLTDGKDGRLLVNLRDSNNQELSLVRVDD